MSKTKSAERPHYELLYIISNKFSEDELNPIVEKVRSLITDAKGEITYTENWGKKHLAYPIKGFSYGYYNLIEFDLDGENLAKVERNFRMMSEVLRHQIIKVEAKAAVAKAAKPASPAKEVKETKTAAPAKAKATDKDKTELKDLDEKLDKILETNDLL